MFFIAIAALCLPFGYKVQNRILLAASYFFYGYIDWRFIGLIFFCTALNFLAGWKIGHSTDPVARKRWVTLAVTVSLTVLGIFKYLGFCSHELSR